MTTTNVKSKHNFKLASEKIEMAYTKKFESAVKLFETFVEEEKMKQVMAIRSRFASFN
jgi:hypothetical protein